MAKNLNPPKWHVSHIPFPIILECTILTSLSAWLSLQEHSELTLSLAQSLSALQRERSSREDIYSSALGSDTETRPWFQYTID